MEPSSSPYAPGEENRRRLFQLSALRRRACYGLALLVLLTSIYVLTTPRWELGLRGPLLNSPPTSDAAAPGFERALAKVVGLLPGEDERHGLLQPIQEHREKRLRELAVRVRRYKTLLAAWEELHVVAGEDGRDFVRDNIIHQIDVVYKNPPLRSKKLKTQGFEKTTRSYEMYRDFVAAFARFLFPATASHAPDLMRLRSHIKQGGRGVVFTGGDTQAEYLLSSIPTLREFGCELPVEVVYFGDADLSADYRTRLEALHGVTTVNAEDMINKNNASSGMASWSSKPFAVLLSSFREVLYMDADSFFFQNPQALFDSRGYTQTGALFFKDRRVGPTHRRAWLQQLLPEPVSETAMKSRFWTGVSSQEQESGVMVVDKWRHLVSLLLVARLNSLERWSREGGAGIYEMVHGDKETFWLGWELAGDVDYSFQPGSVAGMGNAEVVAVAEAQKDSAKHNDNDTSSRAAATRGGISGDADGEGPGVAGDDEGSTNNTNNNNNICRFCSAQLLHLDADGRPLWVNGWVLQNKNNEYEDWAYGAWKSYAPEPLPEDHEAIEWMLGGNNYCCLNITCGRTKDFTSGQQATLTALINKAKEVGASLHANGTAEGANTTPHN
ncbi:C3HC4 type (RING finger) zinc finger containing protein [Purpureocillium lavendulum]|uniref:C3HC4 type (RING finger) zinc finger containing protein n=1 Tax=Purpureocillium lavendulum TaxID=1247861 RepID=A0AB34FYJ8_9HYPO|nr:C3HC4 type (RING finger) zinc finger containing protein [Purpureocillium lavendulum]